VDNDPEVDVTVSDAQNHIPDIGNMVVWREGARSAA